MKSSDWSTARGERWRASLDGTEAMLAPIDAPLIEALQLAGAQRIADVACGGGGTTLAIRRLAPASSIVRGFDIAPTLIEVARARAGDTIAFEVADLATASPPDVPYDRLVSRFGIMFFEDPPGAFEHLARWLAPKGRFAFAVWGPPEANLWSSVPREVASRFVDIPPIEAGGPGPFRYGAIDPLLGLLERSGLREIETRDWHGTLPIGPSPADAASFALDAFASFAQLLVDAGEKVQRDAREALADRFASYERDGAVRLDASVHIVTGTT